MCGRQLRCCWPEWQRGEPGGTRGWRLLATGALLAFCVVSGFSIGRGYIVGSAAMLYALLVRFAAEPAKKRRVAAPDDAK